MTANQNLRKRKAQDNDYPAEIRNGMLKTKNKRASTQNGLQTSFICLIICTVLLIAAAGLYTDSFHPLVDGIALKFGYKQPQYAVIIDAGSTGSRVIAYEFHKGYLDGRLVLDSELFIESKPGLSSFHDEPKDGAQSIEALLQKAKAFVPQSLWSSTPLVLKATAGLRLLLPVQAENLLNEVRETFLRSGFAVKDDAVEIMDGVDEGIFSWFTVNFLLGRLNSRSTVAALDLGGGSTQVTFAPKDVHKTPLMSEFMHTVSTQQATIDVFTNSYLNLGLMAVRHAIFTKNQNPDRTELVSECVNPIVKSKRFEYAKVEYSISGKDHSKSTRANPIVDFDVCMQSVRTLMLPLVQPKPVTLNQHQIAAFSYFFERMIENGLIDPFEGGEVAVGNIIAKAKEVCATANTDQPFMCLDLTYIAVLLKDGYGLNLKTNIKLYKKINGHEISWALGCAYNMLADMSRNTKPQ